MLSSPELAGMGEDGRAGREFEPVTPASNTTKPDHRGSAEVRRKEAGCLFYPLPYQLSFPAARRSHVGIFHFVARDRHRSLLIGPVPIRKRAAFNAKVKGMIRLIDRVGAKVRNGTMYRRLILIRCAFKTVITRKFWARLTYNRYGEMAICIKYKHAPWIRT